MTARIAHLGLVLQARETLCAHESRERKRAEGEKERRSYQAGADRGGGEEGESKREREGV